MSQHRSKSSFLCMLFNFTACTHIKDCSSIGRGVAQCCRSMLWLHGVIFRKKKLDVPDKFFFSSFIITDTDLKSFCPTMQFQSAFLLCCPALCSFLSTLVFLLWSGGSLPVCLLARLLSLFSPYFFHLSGALVSYLCASFPSLPTVCTAPVKAYTLG